MANEKTTAKPAVKANAVTYTVEEFASAPETVGVASPDIIKAALRVAGKTEATVEEAKKLVKDFKEREV